VLGQEVFIAETATVIGDVRLGDQANVWFGTVLRGDIAAIHVGARSNLQDLTVCHVATGKECRIGQDVSVGHRAIVHACTLEDGCLIGMGAIVLDGAVVGKESIVAAGAVVPPGMVIPPGSMMMGVPGRVRRELTPEERQQGRIIAAKYVELAKEHRAGGYELHTKQ
jgi:carbonic anhydrase/acetyltransferase-like protein (isoleucine patch superfamily)